MITFRPDMRFSINSFIYTKLIDRILAGVQKSIIAELDQEDRVLDIACGTGSLSLAMAEKVKEVRGIDLSDEMIGIARQKAARLGRDNVSFELKDASDLSEFEDRSFDLAVTSMSVHQFDPELAISILMEMKRIAGRVIVMDYNHPMRPGISKLIITLIEWIAGGDHCRNFRIYKSKGGLNYFISKAGIVPDKNILYNSSSFIVLKSLSE